MMINDICQKVHKKRQWFKAKILIYKKSLRLCKNAISYHTNLTEICILYGFKDYTSFFRAFKKEFGMSPKEFKELSVKTQEKQD